MVSARAKRLQETDPRKVRVLDRNGLQRWHPLWDGNPRIARQHETGDFQVITDSSGARPYIVSENGGKWVWRAQTNTPGEIYLTAAEQEFGAKHAPQVVIEPHLKPRASSNKAWGLERWKQFIGLARGEGYRVTQLGPAGTQRLPQAEFIETPDFRKAAAVLANAAVYVGPDGGLHHVAAAFGVPAIVIRGGFISGRVTGYAGHVDMFTGEGLGCGNRTPCPCCVAAMAKITPIDVLEKLKEIFVTQRKQATSWKRAEQQPQAEVDTTDEKPMNEPLPVPALAEPPKAAPPVPVDTSRMVQFGGWHFPAHEKHLPEWMAHPKNRDDIADGRVMYQGKKLRAVLSFCKSFRTVVDCGAHCGTWSYYLAQRFLRVESFEPVAAHRECFRVNMKEAIDNGRDGLNVTLHDCALGDKPGNVRIQTTIGSSGDSHIAGEGDIPMITLDSLNLQDVDLIKIDVEGAEDFVIRGAMETIKRCRPVIIVEQKGHAKPHFGIEDKESAVHMLEAIGMKALCPPMSGDWIMGWE